MDSSALYYDVPRVQYDSLAVIKYTSDIPAHDDAVVD